MFNVQFIEIQYSSEDETNLIEIQDERVVLDDDQIE